ncbi:hypothetical protein COUCH_36000 [Couchioplanes caeruleus]|uniref:hypothetical protein n=1 Tax=Couchioplanes caeruleus TaxID=56438 RepID=UPI0020C05674|nr:hypothetical protein [Couchioplanes caeruleus]UQU64304.1 hypothetical protein COUCH_36000 [Couchioplanes caeruleus]
MLQEGAGPSATAEPGPDSRGLVGVARDIALFRPGRADKTRSELEVQLKKVWYRLIPQIVGKSPDEQTDIRNAFHSFCDAAAHRRVRRRQMFVIAYALMAVLAGGLTVALIGWTLDWTRPAILFAYLVTALLLVGAASWAVHRRSPIGTAAVAASSGALAWELWPHSPSAAWWYPRTALALLASDGRGASAGIALGCGLTLVLIVLSLVSIAVLTVVLRSRLCGGSSDVRAFDHFLEVERLLVDTERRPGINLRPRMQEELRNAVAALRGMVRDGRPVGWPARWHGRKHRREHVVETRRLIVEVRRPNPLAGTCEADARLLSTVRECVIGICQDRLGEVLTSLEKAAVAAQTSSATRRKLWQLGAVILLPAILLLLRYFDVPMPDVGW